MRNIRLGVALIVAASLSLTPVTAAHAVTNSSVDPTGDTATATNDITNVSVTLDINTVSIAITTAAALPARTDSSWGTDDTDGRQLAIALNPGAQTTDADGPGIMIDHSVSAVYEDSSLETKLCDATTNISGTVLTTSFPASCLDNAGKLKVTAALGDLTSDVATAVDYAIENGIATIPNPVNVAAPGGYWLLGSDGGVFSFGDAQFFGSTGNIHLNKPVVGMSAQPDHLGYRFVATDGGVFAYGSAGFYGSTGNINLNKPVVGMATTPSGHGYWLVASDGGIFAYGDAAFYGSTGAITLNKPVVGMARTPSGHGYWLVASDGGIFAYGDAAFYGSTGAIKLNKPVVGMASTASGHGYWLVASDGGIFAYGDANFVGSGAADFVGETVVGMHADGGGYRLLDASGDVRSYGPSFQFGDNGDLDLNGNPAVAPFVGFANRP